MKERLPAKATRIVPPDVVLSGRSLKRRNIHGQQSSRKTLLEEAHRPLETGDCPGQDPRRTEDPYEKAPLRQPSRLGENEPALPGAARSPFVRVWPYEVPPCAWPLPNFRERIGKPRIILQSLVR
jgi:hypothetical protein